MREHQLSQAGGANYLERYALHCAPFEKHTDERFFYAGNALMQRLDLLTHLTQFGDSVVVVSGPEGSGKSTLLRRFLAQASQQWRICALQGHEFEHFTQRLGEALGGVSGTSAVELLSQWAARSDPSQLLVVVIDEAERLDEQALNQLSELLNSAYGGQVRLILFGTAGVNDLVRRAQERQSLERTTQLLEMPRLSVEETSSYLMYRLAVAGYSGESPFTATEIRGICKAADGRPAAINELAHEALLEHHARATDKRPRQVASGPAFRTWLRLLLATAGLVLLAYLGLRYFAPETPPREVADLARAPITEVPLQLPAAQTPPVAATHAPQIPPLAEREDRETPIPPAPAPGIPADEIPAPATTEIPLPDEPPAEPAATDRQPAQESAAPGDLQAETTDATTPPAEEDRQEQPDERPLPGTTVPALQAPQTAEAGIPQPAAVPAPEKPTLPHREAWLLEQPESSYSLQLLGSRSEKSVNEFIRRHQLDRQQTAYYRGTHKGEDWYVLLFGLYPNRQAALEARARLPEAVRSAKPWPRDLKAVQTAIREAR